MGDVRGIVFFDVNKNKQYDPGEPGISGVKMVLEGDGICMPPVFTKEDGSYTISGLSPDVEYTLYCSVSATSSDCPPIDASMVTPPGYNGFITENKQPVKVATEDSIVENINFGVYQEFNIVKEASKSTVVVGEEYKYTVTVTNKAPVVMESAIVSDLLSPDIQFIEGSVVIDSVPSKIANIISGVELGSVPMNTTKTIEFLAKVINKTNDTIENEAIMEYTFYPTPDSQLETRTIVSNQEEVSVYNPGLSIVKEANKKEVTLDDEINYTVAITDVGDSTITDIIYYDKLSPAVELVEGSFLLNGTAIQGVNLATGVNIGSLEVEKFTTIEYKVKVISGTCSGYITNCSSVTYGYQLPGGFTGVGKYEPICDDIKTDIAIFKQITLDTGCQIPDQKPPIEEVDNVSIEADIQNSYVIRTPKIITNEEQRLTGYKLIVHGTLNVVIQYTAALNEYSVHSAHYSIPFSSFIILPPDYNLGYPVEVSALVENSDAEITGSKNIFINVALLLVANVA